MHSFNIYIYIDKVNEAIQCEKNAKAMKKEIDEARQGAIQRLIESGEMVKQFPNYPDALEKLKQSLRKKEEET